MKSQLNLQVGSTDIDTDVMVQLFSPIVASQRIMFCQFDNSYTSIQLEDDLNFVFEEVSNQNKTQTNSTVHELRCVVSGFGSFWDSYS